MIPFARISQYGNRFTTWYTGTELIAYDSNIFNASGFRDYTGKTISVLSTVYGTVGVAPTIGTQTDLDYGVGINLNRGSIGAVSQISTSYLPGDWICDFWVKYTSVGSTVNDFLAFYPLMNDKNASGTSYEFQSRGDTRYFAAYYNNGSTGVYQATASTYLTELRDAKWHHFCIQYNSTAKTLYVYIDGVVKIIFTSLTPVQVTGTTHNGFIWGNYQSRSSSAACIDRYRLRTGNYVPQSGAVGDTAFSPSSLYLYPGTKL